MAEGSGDERITLEGLSAPYSFMDVEDDSSPDGAGTNGGAGGNRGAGENLSLIHI